jgi:uncharacterized membrane protein
MLPVIENGECRVVRAEIHWDRIRSGVWQLPAGMMLAGVLLFKLAVYLDAWIGEAEVLRALWLHSGTGDDARNLLSVLVSAMMTMATLVFSLTIVSLSVAASQFGSRLVRSYVRDTKSKVTLGIFAMTIIYCLLALRVVSGEMSPQAVPHLTVTLGLVLSVICVMAMVVLLHMVAHAIVVDEVIRRVGADLEESIASMPLKTDDAASTELPALEGFPGSEYPLRAATEGYIEAVRYEYLAKFAQEQDAFVSLDVMAGDFVAKGDRLGSFHAAVSTEAARELGPRLAACVLIGPERTPVQDLAFSIRHLVDVALRALSPAINDANTARVVIDRLRGALSRLFRRQLPTGRYADAQGVLRVVGRRHTYVDHIAHALDPIRHSATAQPVVVVTLLEALAKLMAHTSDPAVLRFILDQAEITAAASEGAPHDVAAIQRALAGTRECFEKRLLELG